MTTANYKPLTGIPGSKSTCTHFDWCVGGETTSQDGGRSYKISVFKPWHVYRRKPEWFGQYAGDRYLGKLRWISRHADGKQWKNVYQYGELNKVTAYGTPQDAERIARDLIFAYGYIRPYFTEESLRAHKKQRDSSLGIRCTACRKTRAEVLRARSAKRWEMQFPTDRDTPRVSRDAAQDYTREHMGCACIPPAPRGWDFV